ncbi:hypothetical protein ACFSSB_15440, partial [Lacinutrix gracilariae]
MFAFFLQANAQSIINITTSGGSYTSEKWVSITDGVDGTGTQIWGQGNGTQCDGAGLINENISLPAGTYYVNCYDKYDDSWDGTLISVTAYGSVIGDNGGVSPDDGEDTDASYLCEGTPEELEASFMIVVPVAPCVAPTVTFTVIEDCALGFTVDIDVTDMGDATSYDVQESGASVGTITATGVTNVGPFTNDNAIDLTLVHNVSTLCNLEETGLVNSACPATNDECANAIDLDS